MRQCHLSKIPKDTRERWEYCRGDGGKEKCSRHGNKYRVFSVLKEGQRVNVAGVDEQEGEEEKKSKKSAQQA